jgi:hypothetical protein
MSNAGSDDGAFKEPGYSLMNDGHCDAGQRPK